MNGIKIIFILPAIQWVTAISAQKIVYSEYEREDGLRMNFDIIGKINGNFILYKNTRNKHWIVVFDNQMKQLAKKEQTYIPKNDRLIDIDFFPYADFLYAIYQYRRGNVVYCKATKINGMGEMIAEPVELDTSHVGLSANNRIYTVIASEDRSKICVFKINSRNRKKYRMTTLLFDDQLALLHKSLLDIPMEEKNENLGDFSLDNDGDMVFCKFFRNNNEFISKASIMIKHAGADTIFQKDMNLEKTFLDEIHIKVDNYNKRFFITSFFARERRGNIEGLYFYMWDKGSAKPLYDTTYTFTTEQRRDARRDATLRTAFNDFFIRHIIIRRDGGFIIGSEAYYTTSRFNNWNRWDFLYNSPFFSPFFDGFYYFPYFTNFFWNIRFLNNQSIRFHAENVMVLSFNHKGEPEWSNTVSKSQFSDENDDLISYQLMNTGDQLHFLFNQQERRISLLTDYSISPDGELSRNPTLKNLDKGYDFMPKYAKQVSSRQMIIPCIYRNYICFAKIDYGTN